jgi:UDP-N-acetylmuramyl tripeptide synthase
MILDNFVNSDELKLLQKYNLINKVENIIQQFWSKTIDSKQTSKQIQTILEEVEILIREEVWAEMKKKETLNQLKMTMIDPIKMQKNLKQMQDNDCEVVIIEVSSQGLQQNRHIGLGRFEYAAFLNLYPEHIESHGSFEKYKLAKAMLFQSLKSNGTAVVNADDKYAAEMLGFCPDSSHKIKVKKNEDYKIDKFSPDMFKQFQIRLPIHSVNSQLQTIKSFLIAEFEVENLVLATCLAEQIISKKSISIDETVLAGNYYQIPGRMEWVVLDNQLK